MADTEEVQDDDETVVYAEGDGEGDGEGEGDEEEIAIDSDLEEPVSDESDSDLDEVVVVPAARKAAKQITVPPTIEDIVRSQAILTSSVAKNDRLAALNMYRKLKLPFSAESLEMATYAAFPTDRNEYWDKVRQICYNRSRFPSILVRDAAHLVTAEDADLTTHAPDRESELLLQEAIKLSTQFDKAAQKECKTCKKQMVPFSSTLQTRSSDEPQSANQDCTICGQREKLQD